MRNCWLVWIPGNIWPEPKQESQYVNKPVWWPRMHHTGHALLEKNWFTGGEVFICVCPPVSLSCSSLIQTWWLLGAQACFSNSKLKRACKLRLYRWIIAGQFSTFIDRKQWLIDIENWPQSFPISHAVLISFHHHQHLPPPLPSSSLETSSLAFIKIKHPARHVRSISSYNSYENTINKLLLHSHGSIHMWLGEVEHLMTSCKVSDRPWALNIELFWDFKAGVLHIMACWFLRFR